jgi:hypothetical protein
MPGHFFPPNPARDMADRSGIQGNHDNVDRQFPSLPLVAGQDRIAAAAGLESREGVPATVDCELTAQVSGLQAVMRSQPLEIRSSLVDNLAVLLDRRGLDLDSHVVGGERGAAHGELKVQLAPEWVECGLYPIAEQADLLTIDHPLVLLIVEFGQMQLSRARTVNFDVKTELKELAIRLNEYDVKLAWI